jgi:sigma-E factor negative regulatory protein RseB
MSFLSISLRSLIVSGMLLAVADSAFAGGDNEDPERRLASMIKAMHALNYQGTAVLYKNGELDTVRFSHAVNSSGQAQEHVLALDSPLREVLRDTHKVLCIYPEARAVVVDHLPLHSSFLMDFPDSPGALEDSYTLMPAGEETVALQPAAIVNINPKDHYRYARRVWISKENHLPLKYALLNREGKILEQIAFTDLNLNPKLASSYIQLEGFEKPGMNTQHIHQVQQLPFEQAGFTLQNLPRGFKRAFFTRRKMHDHDDIVEHLLLKDGLSSISVYVEKSSAPVTASVKTVGAINSYSREIGAYQITVMGDVPADTVRFIAEGVELREPHD